MSFWAGWWFAYWPTAAVVLLATGAEGGTAAAAMIWLQIPWMLLGWPVKRVPACWPGKARQEKALMALERVREETERVIPDQERDK